MTTVVETFFRAEALFVYVFLFLPIVVVVVFSFNATNRNVEDWQGLSLKWYQSALADSNIQKALWNSATIALINGILATTFGTMAALGLQRVHPRFRLAFDAETLHWTLIESRFYAPALQPKTLHGDAY